MSKAETVSSEEEASADEDGYTVYECRGLAPVCTAMSLCTAPCDCLSVYRKISSIIRTRV